MPENSTSVVSAFAALLLCTATLHAQKPSDKPVELPDRAKIIAALPDSAQATPKKSRKILVFSVTRGFKHDSIPWGIAALEEMGKKTGAFEAITSNDLVNFEADKLATFDAVVFNNTTQNVFMPSKEGFEALDENGKSAAKEREARLKQNLLNFVKSGKGFVGIHAATDTCYEWPEFGTMIGGYFDGHPWTSGSMVSIRVEKPEHPINQCLHGISHLEFKEECYQFKAPYDSKKQDVLLRLDLEKTDMSSIDPNKIKRTDGDFGLSWVRGYGAGRVYYSALGHNKHIYENPKVLGHYLAGIQWALGDLAAPPPPGDAAMAE